jgi:bla regulator protein blaR1
MIATAQRLRAKINCTVAAVCAFLAFSIANLSLVRAQSATDDWEKAAGGKMSFEVASIKQGLPLGPGTPIFSNFVLGDGDMRPPSGVLGATNVPVVVYIAFAYKLNQNGTRAMASQLPTWARQTGFDIEARPEGSNLTRDQVRLMMQSLLAERFKLAVHFETKEGPVYALVLAKDGKVGSQMRPYPDGFPCSEEAPAGAEAGRGGGGPAAIVPTVDDGRFPASCGRIIPMTASGPGVLRLGGRNISMESIIDWVSDWGTRDRPLVDRTGLRGTFDVSAEFELSPPPGPDAPDVSPGASFLEAMNDQLGLKLQSITAPVRSLVIDHIEEPSPN